MKAEKQLIIDTLLERINASPFLLVADYSGMTVPQFAELRKRLRATGSEFHVAKNTFVKRAADTASLPEEVAALLSGQSAVVTGESDVCGAAKALKSFHKEFNRPIVRGGSLDGAALDAAQVEALADLPSKEILQAQLLGVLQTPARQLVTVLNEPLASLARVLQAKADQG
ncbi:MAG: 50S ribosomal protein L10 [Verrucomicrobiae bacterium]|nr:50S ribosomal protein L10 [Verrucomicrobiae bacterium]MCB1232098.1 50S ribosomal protein L10 [Verrucomicrobiae bacterium]